MPNPRPVKQPSPDGRFIRRLMRAHRHSHGYIAVPNGPGKQPSLMRIETVFRKAFKHHLGWEFPR